MEILPLLGDFENTDVKAKLKYQEPCAQNLSVQQVIKDEPVGWVGSEVQLAQKFEEEPLLFKHFEDQKLKSSSPPVIAPETKSPEQEVSNDDFASGPPQLRDFLAEYMSPVVFLLSHLPSEQKCKVVKDMEAKIQITSCSIRLAKLIAGSDKWLQELRHGCQACDSVKFSDTVCKVTSIQLRLALFSWETNGGPLTAVHARPYLSDLWELPGFPKTISARIIAHVWTGVSLRLCTHGFSRQ